MGKRWWWKVLACTTLTACASSNESATVSRVADASAQPDAEAGSEAGPRPDGSLPVDGGDDAPISPDAGCGSSTQSAKSAPAALLLVLDRSSSMANNNKWAFAANAVVNALDADVFDTMSVGVLAVPQGSTTPACLGGFIPVSCGVPPFPQVAITPVGTGKSTDPSSLRGQIKAGLATIGVDNGLGDATPVYAALQIGIQTLAAWPGPGKRLMMLVTDGTIDCTDGSGRTGYTDGNNCQDWESPQNLIDLVRQAHGDDAAHPTSTPVDTFIVGVPGADTYDPTAVTFPPYHMRAALSQIAYAGAPDFTDPACSPRDYTWNQGAQDPALSCHFDMTQGTFTAQELADAIAKVRGEVLGCEYALPTPTSGALDPTQVNVEIATGDGGFVQIPRRGSPSDTCAMAPCWDWDQPPPNETKIELIGAACSSVKGASDASVQIVLGCPTIVR